MQRNPNCESCPLHEQLCVDVDEREAVVRNNQTRLEESRALAEKASLRMSELEVDVETEVRLAIKHESARLGIELTDEAVEQEVARMDKRPLYDRIERLNRLAAQRDTLEARNQAVEAENEATKETLSKCGGPVAKRRRFGRDALVCASFKH